MKTMCKERLSQQPSVGYEKVGVYKEKKILPHSMNGFFLILPEEKTKTSTQMHELQPQKMWLNNILKKS